MDLIPVLIVDDTEVDRYILKRNLSATGLELAVEECENGEEALDYFREYNTLKLSSPKTYPPLIIFLDINMPLTNGLEFLAEYTHLRDEFSLDSSVVMMFTSSRRPEDTQTVSQYDFVKDYLVKGNYDVQNLKEKIINTINSKR